MKMCYFCKNLQICILTLTFDVVLKTITVFDFCMRVDLVLIFSPPLYRCSIHFITFSTSTTSSLLQPISFHQIKYLLSYFTSSFILLPHPLQSLILFTSSFQPLHSSPSSLLHPLHSHGESSPYRDRPSKTRAASFSSN